MKHSLIHIISRKYLIFSLVLITISAPLFYVFINNLYIKDTDETLYLLKDEFIHNQMNALKISEIEHWNRFNRDIKIVDGPQLKTDTLFYATHFDALSNENEPYRELHVPISIEEKPFLLTLKISLVETEDLVQSILLLFLIFAITLIVGIYFIATYISKTVWKPFDIALNTIEKFELDKKVIPTLPSTTIDEFNRLNSSLMTLMQRNVSSYNNQQEFIENAAHEMQTPLAILQNKIEVMTQNSNLTETQASDFAALQNSVSRLNKLNKNLLFLSKIDSAFYETKAAINLSNLLENSLQLFQDLAQIKNITLKQEILPNKTIIANSQLTESLLNNLLQNAIRHSENGSKITVLLTNKCLTFKNSGSAALNINALFKRFSKSAANQQGNGLGLAIVKSIADVNQWTIHYTFEKNMHVFSIDFSKFKVSTEL